MKNLLIPFFALTALLLLGGCASPDTNPPAPKSNVGYLDLYSPHDPEIYWDVAARKGTEYRRLYSKLKPPTYGFVRLALPPGTHELRVITLNLAFDKPADTSVSITAGQVTPVELTLTLTGTAEVKSKEMRMAADYKTRHRHYDHLSAENQLYSLTLKPQAAVAYQTKAFMPYAETVN